MEDITRITPEEIRAFYRTYYVPEQRASWSRSATSRPPRCWPRSRRRSARSRAGPSRRRSSPSSRRRTASGGCWCSRRAQLPIVYLGYPCRTRNRPTRPRWRCCRSSSRAAARRGSTAICPRAPARARGRRRLLVLLARSQPVLVLGHAAAGPDGRDAREGAAGRDGAAQARAGHGRGADAGQEPDRVRLRLPGRLDSPPRVAAGPLRADRRLRARRTAISTHPRGHRRRRAARRRELYFQDDKKNVGILLPKP